MLGPWRRAFYHVIDFGSLEAIRAAISRLDLEGVQGLVEALKGSFEALKWLSGAV